MRLYKFLLKNKEIVDALYPNGALQEFLEHTKPFPQTRQKLGILSVQARTELLSLQMAVRLPGFSKTKFPGVKYDFLPQYRFDWKRLGENEKERFLSEIEVKHDQTKKIITDIYGDHSLFNKIEPREFEQVICELLRGKGYDAQLTKQTRDNGYDILAIKLLEGNIPFKMLVECKRYKNKIGVEIIRSFKEVISNEQANLGMIATTSYFTRDAKRKQRNSEYILNFKDRNDIIDWVSDYIIHL